MKKRLHFFVMGAMFAPLLPGWNLSKEELPIVEEIQDAEEDELKRIKSTVVRPTVIYSVKDLGEEGLREYMKNKGFKNLTGLNLYELRRVLIAWEYDSMFWDMHERTGFPISLFFAFFVYEATIKGIESDLWRNHWNPGGIKWRPGEYDWVKKWDDCNGGKCKFVSLKTYEESLKVWSGVFKAGRYTDCKSYSTPEEICKCIRDSGYHSDESWKARSKIMKEYWVYRDKFPKSV